METFDRTILLVEDDGNDQFLIGRAVRRTAPGTDLRVVPDVATAIAYLSGFDEYADRDRHPLPDYIITDLHLPVTNGFHLLEKMKASPTWWQIPVIVLASSNAPRDVAMAYRFGAAAYFVKPNGLEDLESLVRHIVAYWSGAAVSRPIHGPRHTLRRKRTNGCLRRGEGNQIWEAARSPAEAHPRLAARGGPPARATRFGKRAIESVFEGWCTHQELNLKPADP